MPSNQFSKQPQQLSSAFGGFLNGGNGDQVVGGVLTGIPANLTTAGANAGGQDIPGDRLCLGMADALALSKTSIGTLYGGVYQYVTKYASDVLAAVLGKIAFIRTASANDSYTVTSDESGTTGAAFGVGVYINVITPGYSGYIQNWGKATGLFTTPLTGVPAAGCGVYIAADAAGRFDVFAGSGAAPTIAQVDAMNVYYRGIAGPAPAANTASVIELACCQMRW